MQAPKLKAGDEIRIISPANSLGIIAGDQISYAKKLLEHLGFTISFAGHAYELDTFSSSSIASRVEDIHNAFSDPNVSGILTTLGGHNSNQLLRELDYNLIAANPKRLCGYSDITVLSHAIYAKTGLITYSGPHFSTFGMHLGNEYTVDYFVKMMMGSASRVSREILQTIIKSKKELEHLPVVAGVDFGHTSPIITFPIGGRASLQASQSKVELKIWELGDRML